MNEKLYRLMNWPEIEAIIYSEEDDPHRLLGPHREGNATVVQAFYPGAVSMELKLPGQKTVEMEQADEAGYYAALVGGKEIGGYTLKASLEDGTTEEFEDPYRFAPVITKEDTARFAAGIHYEAYRILGAHMMTIDKTQGVHFAVWAPNALRVSVVGDFNHWDGRRHQMRRLWDSGIFEIFIPGVKEGENYKFELKLKGGLTYLKADPYAFGQQLRPDTASVVRNIDGFAWEDERLQNGWYAHMKYFLDVLGKAGVQFSKKADGTYLRTQGFGQPGRWWVHIANGMTIKRAMARIVRDAGINTLDNVMAVKILTDNGKACGALGWNVRTGEFVLVRAKTVVSAQGRSATRGTDNSTHNPFNVWMYPYNTSAGVVLGYDVGAAVTELDTYQRATMLPKGYGCPGMNGINSSGAHEINALGERFMGKYDPMMENGVRNNQIQGTFQEQMEGSGPPFYMDMRHVDKDVVHELQYVLMPGDKATFGDWADCTGTDFQHKLLEVEIGELIFGGTIAVNDTFETTVPNLFCGSIFLYCSGAMCGGYEAGRQAGMRAAGITEAGKINEDLAASVKKDVFAPMQVPADEGVSYKEIEQTTRNVMNYYMGFRRSMAGMARALEKIRFLSGQAGRLHADTLRDLMRCHESRDILTVCELAIQATMERKETGRCVYKLRDYPELNPDMAKPLLLIRGEDGPRFQWGKAPLL